MSDQTELQLIAKYLDRLDIPGDGDFLRGIAAKLAAAEADAAAQREKVRVLREALHGISLCSQNSMSDKNECGGIARKALATTEDV